MEKFLEASKVSRVTILNNEHNRYFLLSKGEGKAIHETTEPASCKSLVFFRMIAFTLAEVLITLAIIGVVAAMTIPSLVQKYQERETVTRVKKAYSVLNSAYKMALASEGEFNSWGFNGGNEFEADDEGNNVWIGDSAKNTQLFWELLGKHLNITEKCLSSQNNCYKPDKLYDLQGDARNLDLSNYSFFTLNDGMTLLGGWIYEGCKDKNDWCADFAIDVNGIKNPPNSTGKDIFYFIANPDRITPMGDLASDNNEQNSHSFDNSCNNDPVYPANSGYGCTAWIIKNSNMDYLHCDDLSWEGKQSCSDK